MARLRTIDKTHRDEYLDHEKYLKERYGYQRIPERREGNEKTRRTATNQPEMQDTRTSWREANTPDNNQSQTRYSRRYPRTDPRTSPRRFKRRSKVAKALHPVSLIKRVVTWSINLFFFGWQLWLGVIFLLSLGAAMAIEAADIANILDTITGWLGFEPKYILFIPWILIWLLGWLNMAIVWLFFLFTGTHSLSGNFEEGKYIRFCTAMVLYALPIPFLNMVPWVFLWSEFVLKNPK